MGKNQNRKMEGSQDAKLESIRKEVLDKLGKLAEMVDKLEVQLSHADKTVRKTVIQNLAEFCKRIPKMNIADEEQILKALESQPFADFYQGMFEDYISGFANAVHKEEVLERIRELFGI